MRVKCLDNFASEIVKLRKKLHRQGLNFLKDIRQLRQLIKNLKDQSRHLRKKVRVMKDIKQEAIENKKLEQRLRRPKTKLSSTNLASDTKIKYSSLQNF